MRKVRIDKLIFITEFEIAKFIESYDDLLFYFQPINKKTRDVSSKIPELSL